MRGFGRQWLLGCAVVVAVRSSNCVGTTRLGMRPGGGSVPGGQPIHPCIIHEWHAPRRGQKIDLQPMLPHFVNVRYFLNVRGNEHSCMFCSTMFCTGLSSDMTEYFYINLPNYDMKHVCTH